MANNGRKQQVAMMLASGSSIRRTAQEIGISERQISRWLKESSFQALIKEIRGRVYDRGIGRLTRGYLFAIETIFGLLRDKDARIRLESAKVILNTISKIETDSPTRSGIESTQRPSFPPKEETRTKFVELLAQLEREEQEEGKKLNVS